MLRLIRFLVLAVLLVAAVVFLVENPGRIGFDWLGWRVDTSVAVALVATLMLVGLLTALWRAFGWVLAVPGRIGRGIQRRRERRGLRALTRGLTALAAGRTGEAARAAERIDSLPESASLAKLLQAQALAAEGDAAQAEERFKALLDEEDTAFLGRRGLLRLALQRGDLAAALTHAREARALAPNTPWVLQILFDLHCRQGAWGEAASALTALGRVRALEPAVLAQRQATVALALAGQAEREGAPATALRHARVAAQAAPQFVPAVVALARLEAQVGKRSKALAAVEALWRTNPHPDLAAAYLAAVEGDALDRFKRAERLAGMAADHVESHMILGVTALDAKLWGEAKRHFEDALRADPGHPRRALRGLARAEGDGFDHREQAISLRERASEAPDDPHWHCTSCGMIQPTWAPVCGACGAIDSLTWRTAGAGVAGGGLVTLVPDTVALPPAR
ncbi:MAG: heme biosynthesis HemY N-terminal domain-containing protein [Alphaproteobacteria bacterium]|nr:heme biosynthesis HemY N-terminal domain-containing protein [Alphaproteobacteria bacterium]